MIYAGLATIVIGLVLLVSGLQEKINQKLDAPKDGRIATVNFRDTTGSWKYDDGTKVKEIKLLRLIDDKKELLK